MRLFYTLPLFTLLLLGSISTLTSCSREEKKNKEEQIAAPDLSSEEPTSDSLNSVQGNVALGQLPSTPNAVVLTGMSGHRLVTVYKERAPENGNNGRNWLYKSSYDEDVSSQQWHFMPGIDVLYGYNLLNIAHYDLRTHKLNYFFKHAALIKTLYYPSVDQDSLYKKPVHRHYYLVSVYDEDTNRDSLINRKDLRRFYLFDSTSTQRTQLVPANYSVIRSQYDAPNV